MQRRRHRLERPFRLVKETVDEIRRVFAVLTPDDACIYLLLKRCRVFLLQRCLPGLLDDIVEGRNHRRCTRHIKLASSV